MEITAVSIPVALKDTLKLLRICFSLLKTSCTRLFHYDTEIMTYAEIVPSWFLSKVKVVHLTRNGD